jgi:type III secretion system TyeA family effector delivery regulator
MATQVQISTNNQRQKSANNIEQDIALKVGSHRGNAISQISNKDIDDFIRRQFNDSINKGLNRVFHQPISQLAKNINLNSILLSPKDLANYSKKIKDAEGSTKDARQFLQSLKSESQFPKIPNQRATRKEVMQYYLALQKLGHALQSSDEDFAAVLTDNTEHASTLNELARHLQEKGNDKEKLSDFLMRGKELADDGEKLLKLLQEARYNNNDLKNILKKEQGLPDLSSDEKREFLDKIKTQLLILEQDHSRKIYASLNSLSIAETTSDPDNFIDSYSELVHSDESLGSQIEALCKHYDIKELILVIPEMKQALAEDLGSQPRSMDKLKLQHIIANMSILNTSQTVIIKVIEFSIEMSRIFTLKINEKNMLLSLVKLVTSSWVSPSQIENLAKDHQINEKNAEIYFLTQGVKGIVSHFPTQFFTDLEMRKSLLTAAQDVIDTAIQQEEENSTQTSLNTELIERQ